MPGRYQASLVLANFDDRLAGYWTTEYGVLDLSAVDWIDAYALVALTCLVARRSETGHPTTIRLPGDPRVVQFLADMGTLDGFERLGVHLDLAGARPDGARSGRRRFH